MDEPRLITVILAMFLSMGWLGAQNPDSTAYRQLAGFPFVIISEESLPTPPEIPDSLFDAAARGIRFKVNRTELQPNDPFIALYNEQLVPWLKSQEMELRQVYVKGAASPEGPYLNNVRLSRARTQRLIDFLSKGLGQPVAKLPVNAQSVTEDYGQLVRLMQQAGDPDTERVRAIWESCRGDEAACKRQLMALDRGVVWQRLLKEYFPSLRQARMILWFARKKDVPVKKKYNLEPFHPAIYGQVILPENLRPSLIRTPFRPPVQQFVEEPDTLTRRHLVAARTNLVHDLLYVPQFGFAPGGNVQLEYYPLDGHWTLNAGFTFTNHRHWDEYKFFQIRDGQLEARRYFRGGGAFTGPYLSAYGEGTVYGIGFGKDKGWEGEGGGGGLSAGWVWTLNRQGNLRLEISASLGVFYTRHDPYVYGNPLTGEEDGLYYYDFHGNASDFKERNHQFFWFGPTNAGIHLTYDILYRKWKPKGVYSDDLPVKNQVKTVDGDKQGKKGGRR